MRYVFGGWALLSLALAFIVPTTACAGSFDVSPVRMVLMPGHRIGAFTVTNDGSKTTTIQVRIVRWTQNDDKNVYKPTQALLASPPIFSLSKGEVQTIRVGLRSPSSGQSERAYRMFLAEVPPPRKPGFNGLAVALRLSVPIFVHGKASVAPSLVWQLKGTSGRVADVTARDTGSAHIKIKSIRLFDNKGRPMGRRRMLNTYLLPGQTHTWRLPVAASVARNTSVHIRAATDHGEINAQTTAQAH